MAAHVQAIAQYSDFWDQYSSFMTGLVRFGEVEVASVADLVDKVVAKLSKDGSKLALLELFAHGSPNYIKVGDKDVIHEFTPKTHMPALARLKPHLTGGGAVVLQVCKIGQARGVLIEISRTLGVPVYANTGDVNPNLGGGDGTDVRATPDGVYTSSGVVVPSLVDGDSAVASPPPDPRWVYGT